MNILNKSAIWPINKESHKTLTSCLITSRRRCKPSSFKMELINFREHRLLNHTVKRKK